MAIELRELLLKSQITYLRDSVDAYLTKQKITPEERRGVEKFRDYQIEELELMLEKLNSK